MIAAEKNCAKAAARFGVITDDEGSKTKRILRYRTDSVAMTW